MARYFAVVSSGHSGTTWLAKLLAGLEPKLICYKEKFGEAIQYRGDETLASFARGEVPQNVRSYAEFFRTHAGDLAGDCQCYAWTLVPEINKLVPIDRCILLVRDGISTVHSLWYQSMWAVPRNDWLYEHEVRRFAEQLGFSDFDSMSRWARACVYWASNLSADRLIPQQLGASRFLRIRFEDLLSGDAAAYASLSSFLEVPDLRDKGAALSSTNINQHIALTGRDNRWNSWVEQQQDEFLKYCGEAMGRFGYSS